MTSFLIYKYCCSQEKCYFICHYVVIAIDENKIIVFILLSEATCGKVYFVVGRSIFTHTITFYLWYTKFEIIADNVEMLNVKNKKS